VRGSGFVLAGALLLGNTWCTAETGAAGWLRYAPIENASVKAQYSKLPDSVVALDDSALTRSAQGEIVRGINGMLDRKLRVEQTVPTDGAFVLGTVTEVQAKFPGWRPAIPIRPDGYVLATRREHGHTYWLIAGADPRGVLYGTFRLLQEIAEQRDLRSLAISESPSTPVRWVDQWDNLNGTIERGYAGRSIFFDNGGVRSDVTRAGEYARLLASVGIDGCAINNVNADLKMLTPEMIAQVARIADAFRPWGVRLAMSVDLSSPKVVGGLDTFDPLDSRVIAWWQKAVDQIYAQIPDFAGFVVKADSEGRAGPSQYGRTPVDAANVLARALKPHGGLLLYRAFVYNHHLDWNDLKADRARAAYEIFHPLDGKFDDNVIVQIKHGPIDFQVREPVSPLFAGLQKTNEAIELQITQEYTGQGRHLVFLVPMWKETLDFDLRADNRHTSMKEIVEGKAFDRPLGGFAGVANVGLDTNWLGHPMAMANLYGFGRLAWNPDTTAQSIADDWTRLTFGNNPKMLNTIDEMLLSSWKTYEQYTGPLGLGTLTDILHSHYGPGIESAERNGWGQWIRADHEGVGMDRTVATGTGYIGQYPPEVASMYESLATCPDELLLFMHHVPYTYKLRSGETVIQHIYDAHYDGAASAAKFVSDWQGLQGLVDDERYEKVLALLAYQAGHAGVWRDAVNQWFYKMSGIADVKGRVGHDPDRVEAENMQLTGYAAADANPWETASGGKGVVCQGQNVCTAATTFSRTAGTYDIAVQYFDFRNGVSTYGLYVDGKLLKEWRADNLLPGDKMNGDTSTRITVSGVALRPGDVLKIEGHSNDGEPAPLDYLEISTSSTAH
jgi:alpha-glucuronidase